MSLTKRIQKASTREYQASDGTTYLLQRVNDLKPFLSEGMLPAILKVLGDEDLDQLQGMTNQDVFKRLLKDQETAGQAMRLGMEAKPRKLRSGLVGELLPDGNPLYYVFVNKPVHQLADGEINPEFIPDELGTELANAIDEIGKPAVEARDVERFPR